MRTLLLLGAALALAACNLNNPRPTPTVTPVPPIATEATEIQISLREPAEGAVVSGPLHFSGESNLPVGFLTVVLTATDGRELYTGSVPANDGSGHFSGDLSLQQAESLEVTLRVQHRSGQDGSVLAEATRRFMLAP